MCLIFFGHIASVCVCMLLVVTVVVDVLNEDPTVAAACAYITGPAVFISSHSLRAGGKEIFCSVLTLIVCFSFSHVGHFLELPSQFLHLWVFVHYLVS